MDQQQTNASAILVGFKNHETKPGVRVALLHLKEGFHCVYDIVT